MPSSSTAGPPPSGAPSWQLRWITFHLDLRKDGLSTSFRLSREATHYPGNPNPVAVAAWDATLTDELPSLPVGTRWYLSKAGMIRRP